MKSKCVHTIAIDDWRPDVCAVTLPNLKAYADRIGADFNVISKCKFPDYPRNYERLQVWEDGKDYQWNIVLDADTILHPAFEDPTFWMPEDHCGSLWSTDAKYYFQWNKYFQRDGRNIGIADCFVVSSWLTHDLWRPLELSYEEAKGFSLRDPRMISEYCLSVNLAKYGLKFTGAARDHSKHFSPMVTTNNLKNNAVELFNNKLIEWGVK